MGDCVLDRPLLELGGADAAEAEVDDLRSMVDGVDDRRRLVDVAERTRRTDGPHHQQLCVAAEACDALVVRDGARGERGDEGPVAVPVRDVRPVVDDVPGLRDLGREIRLRHVDAGVDDADLDRARRAQDVWGDLIFSGRDVLPFVRKVRAQDGRQSRFDLRRPGERRVGELDPGDSVQVAHLAGKLDLDRPHVREPPDDLRAREAAQRSSEPGVGLEADDGVRRCRAARRARRREDGRSGERSDQQDEQAGDSVGSRAHPGGRESGKGPAFEIGRAVRVRYPESRDGLRRSAES